MATDQLISTMATPLLVFGYTIMYEAIDPATGAAVSGVKITNPNLTGINLSGDTSNTPQAGPFLLVPGPNA